MDLEHEILREHSRRQAERIARWVGKDRKRFGRLVELLLEGEYVVSQRAAWVVRLCAEGHPDLVRPYLKRMVDRMVEPHVHDAVRRDIVGLLQFVDIPEALLGTVATICFDFLSGDAPVATKAFSMTVLAKIAKAEPDLRRELELVVEEQLPYASAGFRARARKVLGLSKLSDERFQPRHYSD